MVLRFWVYDFPEMWSTPVRYPVHILFRCLAVGLLLSAAAVARNVLLRFACIRRPEQANTRPAQQATKKSVGRPEEEMLILYGIKVVVLMPISEIGGQFSSAHRDLENTHFLLIYF